MEIDDSIGARHLGSEDVEGVETDVVWLKFEDTSGFGEQVEGETLAEIAEAMVGPTG